MDWIEIRKEYESTDITLKDLAIKHSISEGTMRSRKNREKWQRSITPDSQRNATDNATQRTKQRATKKGNVATRDTSVKREPKIKADVNNKEIETNESPELTDKQRIFVSEYLIDLNATQAAIRAGYSAKTANRIGPELLGKTCIQKSIQAAKDERLQRNKITQDRVLQEYAKIGFVDIKDFLRFGTEKIVIETDDEGKPVCDYQQVIEMKPSEEVDGTIIQEVSISPKGIFTFKLHDKIKALDALSKHVGLFADTHKRRIEDEKLKLDQAKFEADKFKATGGGMDESIQKIQTLAQLLNNPVPNRSIKDLESDE